jgi:hypothetical protein
MSGNDLILLVFYVNDILFIGSLVKLIFSIKAILETTFEMNTLGNGSIVLYLKAQLVQVPQGIFMTQRSSCKQTMEPFNMIHTHAVKTPMVERPRLFNDMKEELVDATLCWSTMSNYSIRLSHVLTSRT